MTSFGGVSSFSKAERQKMLFDDHVDATPAFDGRMRMRSSVLPAMIGVCDGSVVELWHQMCWRLPAGQTTIMHMDTVAGSRMSWVSHRFSLGDENYEVIVRHRRTASGSNVLKGGVNNIEFLKEDKANPQEYNGRIIANYRPQRIVAYNPLGTWENWQPAVSITLMSIEDTTGLTEDEGWR